MAIGHKQIKGEVGVMVDPRRIALQITNQPLVCRVVIQLSGKLIW